LADYSKASLRAESSKTPAASGTAEPNKAHQQQEKAPQSGAPAAEHDTISAAGDQQPPHSIVEKVEYRDQDGNILNEEQVAALAKDGNVSFETKYETKTVQMDGAPPGEVHAPPHPDVEGQNPETPQRRGDGSVADKPASPESQEESLLREQEKPKPASEGNEATG
jgi:dolichyl-phosphate-mannose-protein mannosyltransferase